jgi:hypothetical protein
MLVMAEESEISFAKVSFTIVAALCAAGIIGMWSMSANVARLDERVANLTKMMSDRIELTSARIDQMAKDQREIERRVGVLEGKNTARPGAPL